MFSSVVSVPVGQSVVLGSGHLDASMPVRAAILVVRPELLNAAESAR